MEATKRRRGRPPGSTTKLIADDRVLGVHHFAFLRAWLQGLDLRWSWDRYVSFAEQSSDLRIIERRRKELLAAALHQGHQLNLSLPPDRQITSLLNILSREPVIQPSKVLPTLDEFVAAQGIDQDAYSEAELIELYQDHFGETGDADSSETSGEHVKALNQLAMLIATPPYPSDPLSRWLVSVLVVRLRAVGAVSIKDLVDLVNVYGYRWYRKVEKLGEKQAIRIVGWLQSIEESTGLQVRESSLTSPAHQTASRALALRDVEVQPTFGIVPIDRLYVPSNLVGLNGVFRTKMPNTLGASDDLAAVRAWLRKYEERPHTMRSYKKEVERFYLWCVNELSKPLSSVDSNDCIEYRKFLADVPRSWINKENAAPFEAGWRPFKKRLEPASQKLALVIVQTMFEGLRDSGYLVANPMRSVLKSMDLPSPSINLDRSFSEREWHYVMSSVGHETESPGKRRLQLLLELLVAMGLRTDELAKARMSDLTRVEVREEEPAWILKVTGKRNKQREVPVPDYVVDLIREHHGDFDQAGALPSSALIRSMGSIKKWGVTEDDEVALIDQEQDGSLGKAGIYNTLKRFLKRAADRCEDPEIDTNRLRKASTHWLRHTFGRQAASDEVPIEVIQQALGHSSLSTTTIYMSTERDRMIRAMRKKGRRT